MTAQPARLDSSLEPVVVEALRGTGFDLEGLEQVRAGRRWLIRVIIDSEYGVGLDDIAAVSRAVAQVLDEHEDLLAGPYTLEVTSPGVDRPLTRPRHWRRNRLRLVRVTVAGEGEVLGRVGDCDDGDDGEVTLLVSGALRRVRYAAVDRAVVEVEFRAPPAEELAALGGADRQGSAGQDVPGQDLEER